MSATGLHHHLKIVVQKDKQYVLIRGLEWASCTTVPGNLV